MKKSWNSLKAIGGSHIHLVLPAALFLIAATLNFSLLGTDGLAAGARQGAGDLLVIGPRVAAAILLAAVIQVWLPHDGIRAWFGEKRGLRSLVIASLLGIMTVGGPFTSFPLVASLAAAGVEGGSLVAFLTGWSVLGIQRLVVWEWPLMGAEFVNLRIMSCLALPLIAGVLMRVLLRREAKR